jgi:hypothetical protein
MKIAVVMLNNLEIPYIYDANSPKQEAYGGDWGSPSATVHLTIPEDADPETIMAIKDSDGVVTLVEDPAKVAQKTANQWTQVRAEQRQKLYESDWTCSVIDPPPEILAARDAWLQYRAQLRDVTNQTDPFNIVWPVRPSP